VTASLSDPAVKDPMSNPRFMLVCQLRLGA
jgi:hypothetical protein